MKKIVLALFVISLFGSCSSGMFAKKEKLGCKTNGRNVGAEKLLSGDPKAMKASRKAKFKGTKSF